MKWKVLLCCALIFSLLTGCKEQADPDPTQSVSASSAASVAEPTSEATEQTDPVEQTEPSTEPVPEAVNRLSAREVSASACVLDYRTVAFLTTEYVSGEALKTVTRVTVLDLYSDEILAETVFDAALSLPLQSHCPGLLPLFDNASQECVVYDAQLQEVLRFQAPSRGGVFSADMTAYYYISAQRLYRMDTKTGEVTQIQTDQALPLESIVDYDMSTGRIFVNVHTQYYLTRLCLGLIWLETGEFEVLSRELDSGCFTASGAALRLHSDSLVISDLVLTDYDSAEIRILEDVLPNDQKTSSWNIPATDYLISMLYDPANPTRCSGSVLYRVGGEYAFCQLDTYLGNLELNTVLPLPDGNLLGIARSRRSIIPVLICPDQMSFTSLGQIPEGEFQMMDGSIVEEYAAQAQPVVVAQELSEVRAQADSLEEEYGITILMSNQCEAPIAMCASNVVTTDQAGLSNEVKLIKDALKELDKALELYPEGFFRQFRNEAGERGMLVLLVQDIGVGTTAEGYDVLGVSFLMDDWYPIAVDVTTKELSATFCHEIWHATETKISSVDPAVLSDVTWYRCNPDDFDYTANGGGYFALDTYLTFEGGYGVDSYFVDGYGKTSPYEDRARLMEYVMTSNYYSRKLMEAPALHKKMEVMSEAIRKIFDTTGWEDVRWERDL